MKEKKHVTYGRDISLRLWRGNMVVWPAGGSIVLAGIAGIAGMQTRYTMRRNLTKLSSVLIL